MTTSLSTATEPVRSGFAELHLSEPVLRALDEIGYSDPTPVQTATYPVAITGRDLIVQARTGTGKTAAFGIPLVDKLVSPDPHVQALVLAPTRELAVQSQREIARLGQHKQLHTVAIYGGAPMGRQIDELRSGAQIVSGTPGRVLDHLRRGTLDPSHLKVLVLDEMDEMLSMGFAKELGAILELIPPVGRRQTMCFSATVDGEVRRHAERHMRDPEMISLSNDAVGAEAITHQVYMVSGRDRIGDLVHVLEVEDPESAIIFCNMRSETERVAGGLKQAGFNADWLNGDLPQRDRERIMAQTREGRLRYLVATDVAARGIDISHLTHVINFTFPESAAVYVHRTGRTGRAGRTGSAISLVGPEELGRLYYLRLEYKITPIERSLPTSGERKTRREIDRIGLLETAFSSAPSPTDLAVARRLLTHPDGERILGNLLHTFFGTRPEVDEEAAAARRSRQLPPAHNAERNERESRTRPARPDTHERARTRERGGPLRPRDLRERERGQSAERGEREAAERPHKQRPDEHEREPRSPGHAESESPATSQAQAPRERSERNRRRARDANSLRTAAPGPGPNTQADRSERVHAARTADTDRNAPTDPERTSERTREYTREPTQDAWNAEPALDGELLPPTDTDAASPSESSETAAPAERSARRPRRRSESRPVERARQDDAGPKATAATDAPAEEGPGAANSEDEGYGEPVEHLAGLLYLNLGKRDGVRVGEVARLLRDNCELGRGEIGRIRVRDRYTFVDVPEERLDTIIAALNGQVVHDKALAPERAKTAKG
jgi:ATP-dependent RNA helicase DeaD